MQVRFICWVHLSARDCQKVSQLLAVLFGEQPEMQMTLPCSTNYHHGGDATLVVSPSETTEAAGQKQGNGFWKTERKKEK